MALPGTTVHAISMAWMTQLVAVSWLPSALSLLQPLSDDYNMGRSSYFVEQGMGGSNIYEGGDGLDLRRSLLVYVNPNDTYTPSQLVKSGHRISNSDFKNSQSYFNIVIGISIAFMVMAFIFLLFVCIHNLSITCESYQNSVLHPKKVTASGLFVRFHGCSMFIFTAWIGLMNFIVYFGATYLQTAALHSVDLFNTVNDLMEGVETTSDQLLLDGTALLNSIGVAANSSCDAFTSSSKSALTQNANVFISSVNFLMDAINPLITKLQQLITNVNTNMFNLQLFGIYLVWFLSFLFIGLVYWALCTRSASRMKVSMYVGVLSFMLYCIAGFFWLCFVQILGDLCMNPSENVVGALKTRNNIQDSANHFSSCFGNSTIRFNQLRTNIMYADMNDYVYFDTTSNCDDDSSVRAMQTVYDQTEADLDAWNVDLTCSEFQKYWFKSVNEILCEDFYRGIFTIWIAQLLAAIAVYLTVVFAGYIHWTLTSEGKRFIREQVRSSSSKKRPKGNSDILAYEGGRSSRSSQKETKSVKKKTSQFHIFGTSPSHSRDEADRNHQHQRNESNSDLSGDESSGSESVSSYSSGSDSESHGRMRRQTSSPGIGRSNDTGDASNLSDMSFLQAATISASRSFYSNTGSSAGEGTNNRDSGVDFGLTLELSDIGTSRPNSQNRPRSPPIVPPLAFNGASNLSSSGGVPSNVESFNESALERALEESLNATNEAALQRAIQVSAESPERATAASATANHWTSKDELEINLLQSTGLSPEQAMETYLHRRAGDGGGIVTQTEATSEWGSKDELEINLLISNGMTPEQAMEKHLATKMVENINRQGIVTGDDMRRLKVVEWTSADELEVQLIESRGVNREEALSIYRKRMASGNRAPSYPPPSSPPGTSTSNGGDARHSSSFQNLNYPSNSYSISAEKAKKTKIEPPIRQNGSSENNKGNTSQTASLPRNSKVWTDSDELELELIISRGVSREEAMDIFLRTRDIPSAVSSLSAHSSFHQNQRQNYQQCPPLPLSSHLSIKSMQSLMSSENDALWTDHDEQEVGLIMRNSAIPRFQAKEIYLRYRDPPTHPTQSRASERSGGRGGGGSATLYQRRQSLELQPIRVSSVQSMNDTTSTSQQGMSSSFAIQKQIERRKREAMQLPVSPPHTDSSPSRRKHELTNIYSGGVGDNGLSPPQRWNDASVSSPRSQKFQKYLNSPRNSGQHHPASVGPISSTGEWTAEDEMEVQLIESRGFSRAGAIDSYQRGKHLQICESPPAGLQSSNSRPGSGWGERPPPPPPSGGLLFKSSTGLSASPQDRGKGSPVRSPPPSGYRDGDGFRQAHTAGGSRPPPVSMYNSSNRTLAAGGGSSKYANYGGSSRKNIISIEGRDAPGPVNLHSQSWTEEDEREVQFIINRGYSREDALDIVLKAKQGLRAVSSDSNGGRGHQDIGSVSTLTMSQSFSHSGKLGPSPPGINIGGGHYSSKNNSFYLSPADTHARRLESPVSPYNFSRKIMSGNTLGNDGRRGHLHDNLRPSSPISPRRQTDSPLRSRVEWSEMDEREVRLIEQRGYSRDEAMEIFMQSQSIR